MGAAGTDTTGAAFVDFGRAWGAVGAVLFATGSIAFAGGLTGATTGSGAREGSGATEVAGCTARAGCGAGFVVAPGSTAVEAADGSV